MFGRAVAPGNAPASNVPIEQSRTAKIARNRFVLMSGSNLRAENKSALRPAPASMPFGIPPELRPKRRRMDQKLLCRLARLRENWSMRIIGGVGGGVIL